MRRTLVGTVLGGICAAALSFAPEAMAAKPGPPTITAIAGYSDGTVSFGGIDFCSFHVDTTYSGKAKHRDFLSWYLTTGATTNVDSETAPLGPSPFTVSGGFSPAPSAGTYEFIVTIENSKGTVLSEQTTSTFPLSGTCPAPGELGTF